MGVCIFMDNVYPPVKLTEYISNNRQIKKNSVLIQPGFQYRNFTRGGGVGAIWFVSLKTSEIASGASEGIRFGDIC